MSFSSEQPKYLQNSYDLFEDIDQPKTNTKKHKIGNSIILLEENEASTKQSRQITIENENENSETLNIYDVGDFSDEMNPVEELGSDYLHRFSAIRRHTIATNAESNEHRINSLHDKKYDLKNSKSQTENSDDSLSKLSKSNFENQEKFSQCYKSTSSSNNEIEFDQSNCELLKQIISNSNHSSKFKLLCLNLNTDALPKLNTLIK